MAKSNEDELAKLIVAYSRNEIMFLVRIVAEHFCPGTWPPTKNAETRAVRLINDLQSRGYLKKRLDPDYTVEVD